MATLHLHPDLPLLQGSHQGGLEIRGGGRRPGGGHDAVDWVLLLWVDLLHVEGRVVLGLGLRLLGVHAVVHTPIAVLGKERVDCLYPCLISIKVHREEIRQEEKFCEYKI